MDLGPNGELEIWAKRQKKPPPPPPPKKNYKKMWLWKPNCVIQVHFKRSFFILSSPNGLPSEDKKHLYENYDIHSRNTHLLLLTLKTIVYDRWSDIEGDSAP